MLFIAAKVVLVGSSFSFEDLLVDNLTTDFKQTFPRGRLKSVPEKLELEKKSIN
ncbi:MAG: hypothetical protein NWQ09_07295 [Nonlabens sp.]|nr:hypothetical protein [Nonlabens sp.]